MQKNEPSRLAQAVDELMAHLANQEMSPKERRLLEAVAATNFGEQLVEAIEADRDADRALQKSA